ncbi:MAG: hypothetical protein M3Q50_06500, partial [Chloroflexota bacterium]|nr:hypothetical protein [Chloroflexota bacterium]
EIRGMVSEARGRVSRAITVDSSSIPASRWFLRFWAGTFAFDRGDVAEAMRWARELLAIGETLGEPLAAGAGFAALSRATGVFADRHEEAADLARRAVATFEPLGHDEWTAWGWTRLGIEDHLLGRLEDARASLLKGMETRQRKGCEGCVAYSLVSLGAVSADLGEPVSALDTYRESLRLTIKHENQALMLAVLLGLADVAWQFGAGAEPERDALLLFGAAEAVWRRHDLGRRRAALDAIARWQLPMREALGDEAVDGKIGEGMLLARDEVVALANDLQVSARRRNDTRLEPGRSLLAGYGSIE